MQPFARCISRTAPVGLTSHSTKAVLYNSKAVHGTSIPEPSRVHESRSSSRDSSECRQNAIFVLTDMAPRITTVVSWDLTSVEGVSGGVTMNYTDGNGKKTAAGPKHDDLLGQWMPVV